MELQTIVADAGIFRNVREAGGYCPCAVEHTPDTKCPCRAFRMLDAPGVCHCGLYRKIIPAEPARWIDDNEECGMRNVE